MMYAARAFRAAQLFLDRHLDGTAPGSSARKVGKCDGDKRDEQSASIPP
jgi:hypothetical protein